MNEWVAFNLDQKIRRTWGPLLPFPYHNYGVENALFGIWQKKACIACSSDLTSFPSAVRYPVFRTRSKLETPDLITLTNVFENEAGSPSQDHPKEG